MKLKIVGIMPVYNDEDIIQEVIEHYISQKIPLIVLDNFSTDSSFEICEKFLGRGILKLEQFKSKTFQKETVLRILYDIAISKSADWIIAIDSDEFLESRRNDISLKEAIIDVDNEGYNLIQFDRFGFYMTDNDNITGSSVKNRIKYYSWDSDFFYRAWKFEPGIRCEDMAGHLPIFPEDLKYKIFHKKFVLRHYMFRSKEQAEKKMADRSRGIKQKEGRPLNDHYKKVLQQDYAKKVDHNLLTKYDENNEWNYDRKYFPFMDNIPKKREEIFSPDGDLKIKPKSRYELNLELNETRQKLNELHSIGGITRLGKNAVKKRFKKL